MHRRDFLKATAWASVALAVPLRARAALPIRLAVSPAHRGGEASALGLEHGFVGVTPDGRFVVYLTRHEMGQGTSTAVPQIVAHELGFAPEQIELWFADGTLEPPFNSGAGGSTSTMAQWKPLREAAAGVRLRLLTAARTALKLDERASLVLTPEAVVAGDGRSLPVTQLLEAARAIDPPTITLRTDETRSEALGQPTRRRGLDRIVSGKYEYGLDLAIPGRKVAMLVRAPTKHAKWVSDNRDAVAKLPGVRAVFTVEYPTPKETSYLVLRPAVAIVGDDTWSVMKARRALQVQWDRAEDAGWTVEKLEGIALERAAKPRDALGERGTAPAAQAGDRVFEADYVYPYQLHQLMEPLNATVVWHDGRIEVWTGCQAPSLAIRESVRRWDLTPEQVTVHAYPSGGGFGRRFYVDAVIEAVAIAKQSPGTPVQVVWTREDEIQFDLCHFWQHTRYRAVLRGSDVASWTERTQRTFFGDGDKLPWFGYDFAHVRTEGEAMEPISPVFSGAWRAVVGNSHAFGQEGLIDEIALALDEDPIALRRRLLRGERELGIDHEFPFDRARMLDVLDAVERMQRAAPAREGETAGVAVHAYMHGNCYTAMVAFAKRIDGKPRITRVLCAVDVGLVVNPSQVRAQAEGGVVWGLGPLYHGNVRVQDGEVLNRNYADSPILRNAEAPEVHVEIIASRIATPCGVGELTPPVTTAAAANAISRMTGERVRRLPVA